MSLLLNLMHAEAAVKYVEEHLRGRASNKPEDVMHTMMEDLRARYDRYRVLDELDSAIGIQQKTAAIRGTRIHDINEARDVRRGAGNRLNAAAIIQDGIGNCFEHAVLACSYLNGKGVASYMVTADDQTDHVFAVIGVAAGQDGNTIATATNAAPGPPLGAGDSVVCDPWYHEWFGIQQDWAHKMHRILSTTNRRVGPLPAAVPLTLTASAHIT